MSNSSNPELWAAQERLRFIERSLYWRASVRRRDLGEGFGISLAQASADLQRYFELNPSAAHYDTSAKHYRGDQGMRCVLHAPRLEEAMAYFLDGGTAAWPPPVPARETAGSPALSRISLPIREAAPDTQRAVFLAVLGSLRLRIHYASLSGRRPARWRWIAPHAFGHDGYRWHARAWCEENGDFRDFVLGRIHQADWPTQPANPTPPDEDWDTFVDLAVRPNKALTPDQRRAIEADFGMADGRLVLKVRRAMRDYLLDHLRLPAWEGQPRPPLLQPDDPPRRSSR
jgi:hypothetical protein